MLFQIFEYLFSGKKFKRDLLRTFFADCIEKHNDNIFPQRRSMGTLETRAYVLYLTM